MALPIPGFDQSANAYQLKSLEVGHPDAPIRGLSALLGEIEAFPTTEPDETLRRARAVERAAGSAGRTDLQLRAQLVEADVLCRVGQVSTAGRTAREINRWAAESGDRYLLARSHRVLSLFFGYIGDVTNSLEHAIRAYEWLAEDAPDRLRVDHLLALASALAESGGFEGALERLQAASRICDTLMDPHIRVAVLNAQSWIATDAEMHAVALSHAESMAVLSATEGIALKAEELETLARCQYFAGKYSEAAATLQPVFDGQTPSVEGNAVAYCLLTLALVQRDQGDHEAAMDSLRRCTALCDERNLAAIRLRAVEQLADLYALEERFKEAYEHHQQFHAAYEALISAEGAARAQTLWAVFGTTEARKDSARFQQMAFRDPLTGLYNRRHVDEQLPALLNHAKESGTPLSLGIIDLDKFKRINDTLSHQVGDSVLRGVAVVLEDAVDEPCFVARLGGEEFLMVLPGRGPDEGRACFEKVRVAIRSGSWSSQAGENAAHVTASIGGASTASGLFEAAQLLELADHNLYRAKRSGRDRVVNH